MDATEYIAGFEREAVLLAARAESMDLGTEIPTCPGWTVRELVRHTAGVHRWAGTIVRDRLAKLPEVPDLETLFGEWPDDSDLVDFYRTEARQLAEILRDAPDDLKTGAFIKIEPQKVFWSRRQFQETTIHRVDLDLAAGIEPLVDAESAADGIDEMLRGFVSRRWVKLNSDPPVTLGVRTTDTGDSWILRISTEPPVASREVFDSADCLISGSARDLNLALWNRPGRERLLVSGDDMILDLFSERIQVKW